MPQYKVEIIGGPKKQLTQKKHVIPAPSEEDARAWGYKQSKSLGLAEPVVIVKPVEDTDGSSAVPAGAAG